MKRMGKREKCANLLWFAEVSTESAVDENRGGFTRYANANKKDAEFLIMIAKEYLK